ncbi:glycosyltransferase family 4 protein [Cognatiluteimonas profundi]|uniref:glycosyltransferase family 4 protein n=1 Tax=Cognatiluteimonas profundi TaxID=2594501 RepID=UPI00131EAFDD|nr:glycosyltransferase family 4 protein [Lysobacter profundi]
MSKLSLSIAVCGRFHFHKWVKDLDAAQVKTVIHYSHKIGQKPFGELDARNKHLKEYLMQLHGRVLGDRLLPVMLPCYHRIWENAVVADLPKVNVAHVMLHGNVLEVIKKHRANGAFVIGEAVNAHVSVLAEILDREQRVLGFPPEKYPSHWARMVEEYALCDRILVASSWVKRSFVDAGFPAERIIRVPYPSSRSGGVALKRRQPEVPVKVLCVAGIQPRKGQHYLLEAVRHLRSEGQRISLTFVGRNTNRPFLKSLRAMDVEFNHLPHVANERMIEFMREFDVFVLPSVEDGFSIVVCEALQAGLPVVTTSNNGAADAIVHGKNGFVVPAGDSVALSKAITNAMSLLPCEVVQQEVATWSEYANRMLEMYKDVSGRIHSP